MTRLGRPCIASSLQATRTCRLSRPHVTSEAAVTRVASTITAKKNNNNNNQICIAP